MNGVVRVHGAPTRLL